MGDIIDGNVSLEKTKEDLDRVIAVLDKNNKKMNHIHVIGNHCLTVPRDYLVNKLGLNQRYYDFVIKNWRFIVLDGTDVSIFGWDKESHNYKQAQEWLSHHSLKEFPNATTWNAAIGEDQKKFLIEKLQEAKKNGQKVIIFNHFPLLSESAAATHLLWNGNEIVDILNNPEVTGVTVAFLSGHYHPGGYTQYKGIHYWTLKGILEAPNGSNCFAIVTIFENHLEVKGYGTELTMTIPFT